MLRIVLLSLLAQAPEPETLRLQIVATHPHDPTAFTQGLLLHNGALFESTGNYGQSTVREVEIATGNVVRRADLLPSYFGEGLARVGNELIQLTWREEVALRWDLSLSSQGSFDYSDAGPIREGWGLCYDGTRLVMSDGTDKLYFRDPSTFAITGDVSVTMSGSPLSRINELECVDGDVFANVWMTDTIVRIDDSTGVVTHRVDASGLLTPAEAAAADVLNGIAFDPSNDTFLITGKNWPKLFVVTFEPASTPSPPPPLDDGCAGCGAAGAAGWLAVPAFLIGCRPRRTRGRRQPRDAGGNDVRRHS